MSLRIRFQTPESVAAMRQRLMELWLRWRGLEPGETLELEFRLPTG